MIDRPQKFVDQLQASLLAEVPAKTLMAVAASSDLTREVSAFGQDVLDGLRAVEDKTSSVLGLESRLKSRKTAILRMAQDGHYTLEKLLSSNIEKVLAEARTY